MTNKFEKSIQQLETIVKKMEKGQLSLEDAIGCFEEGITLAKQSQEALTKAQQKVEILIEKNASLTTEPFDEDE